MTTEISDAARELGKKLAHHFTGVDTGYCQECLQMVHDALTSARQQALEDAAKCVEDFDHPCCEGGNLYADEIRAMKVQI